MSTAEKEIARYTWLTTGEVARTQGVSAETVLAWIRQPNGLKAMNVGTQKRPVYRIKPEWVNDFAQRRTRNA